ncbi:MAG: FtsX-like permease family protein, partial [Bacteroidia bacterium]|nr:ABC transporter permease [Bacteroidia bacterium]MDW8335093.1 FtsX-like permease family protein [Bacteroidia bacterium]
LFSPNMPGAVQIITAITSVGMGLITAALVATFSVFNGFQAVLRDLFKTFDADVRIGPARGRYVSDRAGEWARKMPEVSAIAAVLEGRAMLRNGAKEQIVTVKGVDEDFAAVSDVERLVRFGRYSLRDSFGEPALVAGIGVAGNLALAVNDPFQKLELLTLSEKQDLLVSDPAQAVRSAVLGVSGVFALQKDYDDKLTLVPLTVAERLFEAEGRRTSYEVKLRDGVSPEKFRKKLQDLLGPDFRVETWYEQHQTLYEVMRNEKAVAFLVLALMLALTACNIVACLSMVAAEKRRDVGILQALGARRGTIAAVYWALGILIGGGACLGGMVLGTLLCVLQDRFGLLKLGVSENSSFLIQAYPVEMRPADFALIAGVVVVLSSLSSIYPAYRASGLRAVENIG